MSRRRFLSSACALCLGGRLYAGVPLPAYAAEEGDAYVMPGRFSPPDASSDEGGLWAYMDREEKKLRRSERLIKDKALQQYVEDICCRLAGDTCKDARVYIFRTAAFNASMAPNGMMSVWSGLLLRCENESQLAAVLGHEMAHYLQRHSVERLRDTKSRSALASVLGLFGLIGAIGQLGVVGMMAGFSRDQEREADRIGAILMREAGFDVAEAPKIWENLLVELKAGGVEDPAKTVMFASHPPSGERREWLEQFSARNSGGTDVGAAKSASRHREVIAPFLADWLADDIRRGQHEQSVALFSRLIEADANKAMVLAYRGELYRQLSNETDPKARGGKTAKGENIAVKYGEEAADLALADYRASASSPDAPAIAQRGIGFVLRARGDNAAARDAFAKYIQLTPMAPDVALIQSYVEELSK